MKASDNLFSWKYVKLFIDCDHFIEASSYYLLVDTIVDFRSYDIFQIVSPFIYHLLPKGLLHCSSASQQTIQLPWKLVNCIVLAALGNVAHVTLKLEHVVNVCQCVQMSRTIDQSEHGLQGIFHQWDATTHQHIRFQCPRGRRIQTPLNCCGSILMKFIFWVLPEQVPSRFHSSNATTAVKPSTLPACHVTCSEPMASVTSIMWSDMWWTSKLSTHMKVNYSVDYRCYSIDMCRNIS